MAAKKKAPAPAAPTVPAKKPPVARPAFDAKRAKWLEEVRERVNMNIAMEDQFTGAKYPMPERLDMEDSGARNDHVKDRISAAAVIVIERRLKRLSMTIPGSKEAHALESDILDRAGFTRKPQGNIVATGPVLFINGEADAAKMRTVYERQKVLVGESIVDGVQRAVFPVVEKGDPDEQEVRSEEAAPEGRDPLGLGIDPG